MRALASVRASGWAWRATQSEASRKKERSAKKRGGGPDTGPWTCLWPPRAALLHTGARAPRSAGAAGGFHTGRPTTHAYLWPPRAALHTGTRPPRSGGLNRTYRSFPCLHSGRPTDDDARRRKDAECPRGRKEAGDADRWGTATLGARPGNGVAVLFLACGRGSHSHTAVGRHKAPPPPPCALLTCINYYYPQTAPYLSHAYLSSCCSGSHLTVSDGARR